MVFHHSDKEQLLREASLSRVYHHLMEAPTLAIISTYRDEREEPHNRELLVELKREVRKLGLGFNELVSRWSEQNEETGNVVSSDERALLIPNISYEDAFELGKKYDQSSIIFKDANSCREVCTNNFTSWDDKSYTSGDIVRTFNTRRDNNNIFNLDDAKEIFGRRKGGPASKLVKGDRSFHLSEVLEYSKPRASYFQTKGYYKTIYKYI